MVERHVAAEQMRRRDFRDQRAEHDELATLSDRDQDRDAGQDGGSGERRARERCEQDRQQAACEYGAGGEQSVSAAHPRHHPCRRYLRYDDEEGVDEDDDTDPNGPTGVCASANGGRMLEKNAPPIITSARLPAIKASKSRSRATARKPRAPSLADGASARPGSGIQTSTTSAKTTNVTASKR